ncbi:DUF1045 domain-containing protein [Planktotalea sp.]|uniref:DUF1045 domain-containing protein n=1 Tax=Planktotalea sp. TaxID=2029877 RepID=UPI003D6B71D6
MFERYAVYHSFDVPLATQGAAWLGWDIASGRKAEHPALDDLDLDRVTQRPRKYGFHATIMAPFHPADGILQADIEAAFVEICEALAPARYDGLELSQLGRFLALTPRGRTTQINALARDVITQLDRFRAPLSAHDLQRRSNSRMTERQRENLERWGYARVMEDFQFHATLTGNLKTSEIGNVHRQAERFFAPALTGSVALSHLSLVAEGKDGMFHEVLRNPLRA